MSGSKLTRKEALELITPVVDDEVDEDTRIAFLAYIQQDQSVRSKYESAKKLKNVISTRCPCANAPDRLKKRIQHFLDTQQSGNSEPKEEPIYDMPTEHSMTTEKATSPATKRSSTWRYAAAASILVAAIVFGINFYMQSPVNSYNVEEYAYNHFIKHEGKMIKPTISTASIANAELELAHAFDMPVTVPPLKNAEFKGVVFSDFVPGFKTPLMEYYLPSEDQYIYIFAFKITDLKRFEELSRSQEAVNSCIKAKDFHIRNVNGKHVVSWKWDNTWYAAISNHDGKTLASLVEPLGFKRD
ncbi:hypothetical protein NC796_08390 [Aliifodinibius sp. S!AR15-10]|uniref:hypothetical protein n=1 Tax=Aliifodinibius sp. S!AR15-10 TaxID=2950437 RepID=UPI00285D8BEB|nr:hypothetical protein [Aliifodinibius sp. S!AR15-10]MDR8391152.1 hypothetical protein [Aliifodinibius sp. S!AR15-10]